MSEIGNKRWLGLFVWLLLLLSGSCTQTEVEEGYISSHALKEVDAGFHLNVLANRTPLTRSILFTADGTMDADSLPTGDNGRPGTRAASPLEAAQESLIAGIWVGQYAASDGALLYNKYISSLTGNTVNIKLKQNGDGEECRVWFVANVGDLGKITTETALKEHLLSYASTTTGLPESNLCGMTGLWKGVVQKEGIKDIEVKLTRLLAKISFTYSMGGEGFTFTPTAVTLRSVPQKIQIDVPEGQQAAMTYTDYTGIAEKAGATMYWYLPENLAGTASGGNVVDSEKKKTGKGINNATYIELTGTAEQGGVTYNNVAFRFYPGSGVNNYDIERNCHYVMDVTLVGIDISDERITVNEIPPIVVDPEKMPAEKGGIKEVQITARPGQEWSFDIEEWLSAVINGKTAGTGTQVTYQGPALVTFQAVSANPKAEDRSVGFSVNVNGEEQAVTITQSGSTLVKGNDISLGAASGSEGSSSFTVTKGLQWLAALSGEDWWSWATDNLGTSGEESSGEEQVLKVKATANNPFKTERSGKITLSAGASVGDPGYTGLKKEITVKQAGSTVQGSEVNVTPEASEGQKSIFTATPGLEWVSKVTTGDWITLSGTTSGNQTTGTPQDITFNVKVNPSSTMRSGQITVRAGDEIDGPTGMITVKQSGSIFSVSTPTIIPAVGGNITCQVTATAGLDWTVDPETSDNITVSPIKGSGSGTLTFMASANTGIERTGAFTISVLGVNPARTTKVVAMQMAGETGVYIGDLQICKTDNSGGAKNWSGANFYCSDLTAEGKSDWRLPSMDELLIMAKNRDSLNSIDGFTDLSTQWHWSGTSGGSGYHWVVLLGNGDIYNIQDYYADRYLVRCVRDK